MSLQRALFIGACGLFIAVSASCSDYDYDSSTCLATSGCGWCPAASGCCVGGGYEGASCTCFSGGGGCAGSCATGIGIGMFFLIVGCCAFGWWRYRIYRTRVVVVQAQAVGPQQPFNPNAPYQPMPGAYAQPGYAPAPAVYAQPGYAPAPAMNAQPGYAPQAAYAPMPQQSVNTMPK